MSLFSQRLLQIRTNVFIICPNNSGSTLLKRLICTSPDVLSLKREGQFSFGFSGPVCRKPLTYDDAIPFMMEPLTWAASENSIRHIQDPSKYSWDLNKKAWYLQAEGAAPDSANVFVEKTPYFLLLTEALHENFEDCRFIFMVRNPYAAVEGIIKRENTRPFLNSPDIDLAEQGALHLLNCFQAQKENLDRFQERSCFFTYEDLCDYPDRVKAKLDNFLPEAQGIDLGAEVQVKHQAPSHVINMNDTQIGNLTCKQLQTITAIFETRRDLLLEFGYDLVH